VYKAIATALDYPLAPPAGTEMSARLLSADEAVRYELEVWICGSSGVDEFVDDKLHFWMS